MTEVLLLAVIVLSVAMWRLQRRVAVLEARDRPPEPVMAPPEDRPVAPPEPAAAPPPLGMPPPVTPPVAPRPRPPYRHPLQRVDIETLVGSRLPVWIGGLALVVGGIFLVRLSIEAGWLTPALRTVLAALFALVLLAGGEGARRLPATRDDPRIAQVLAGAGIASAYATLYLAAALYHLVGPLAGFAAMLAITALGLFLALRHGPPTAVMALVGGFAAPLVAGYDAAGIGALLVYLGLFVAALMALAIVRGWAWLALSALVAAFGWAVLLIALVPPDRLGGIGAFLVALAIGGTIAAPRAAVARPWLRAAPMAVALVQLLALAPMLDFSALAWGFYLVLSGAALFLAWRERVLLPAAIAAAILVTLLVAAGLAQGTNVTPTALPVAILLFGAAGGAASRRAAGWAVVALVGTAGPLLVAQVVAPALLPPAGWTLADIALALAAAAFAWRHRDRAGDGDIALVGGIAVAALGTAFAVHAAIPFASLAPLAALGVLAVALRFDPRAVGRLALVPVAVLLALAAPALALLTQVLAESILFEALPYRGLPAAGDALSRLALPALAILLAAWRLPALFAPARRPVIAAAAVVLLLGVYVLLKQVFVIATLPAFRADGFVERALLTDLALVAGWALRHRLPRTSRALVALGLARILWFDLLGLNPVLIPQAVGAWRLLNAATLHLALAAALLWRLPTWPRHTPVAATLTLLAILATIRQATHGAFLTGPVGVAENWGYSAAMLALSIGWLWRSVARRHADLRRLGLTLLTLTTFKVFLIDAAALEGVLRILSFMGLGAALIAIGWGYRRFVATALTPTDNAPPADRAPASAPAARP